MEVFTSGIGTDGPPYDEKMKNIIKTKRDPRTM
jgi:hypothetical protein